MGEVAFVGESSSELFLKVDFLYDMKQPHIIRGNTIYIQLVILTTKIE